MRYALLKWLPLAAALDLQLDRLEDLHATLEAHEKEDVLEMTWPKQKWNYSDAASQIDAFLAPRAPLARRNGAVGPRHGPTPRAAGGAPRGTAGRLREGVARAPVGRGYL